MDGVLIFCLAVAIIAAAFILAAEHGDTTRKDQQP